MTSSPSRIRDRVVFAATTALLLVSACGGGSEPADLRASPRRDVPPATRDAPGSTRESPGATREAPGTTACLRCQVYDCVSTTDGQTNDFSFSLQSLSGGECALSNANGEVVFHCDGTLTLTGDNIGSATGWRRTSDGGFDVLGAPGDVHCSPGSVVSAP